MGIPPQEVEVYLHKVGPGCEGLWNLDGSPLGLLVMNRVITPMAENKWVTGVINPYQWSYSITYKLVGAHLAVLVAFQLPVPFFTGLWLWEKGYRLRALTTSLPLEDYFDPYFPFLGFRVTFHGRNKLVKHPGNNNPYLECFQQKMMLLVKPFQNLWTNQQEYGRYLHLFRTIQP